MNAAKRKRITLAHPHSFSLSWCVCVCFVYLHTPVSPTFSCSHIQYSKYTNLVDYGWNKWPTNPFSYFCPSSGDPFFFPPCFVWNDVLDIYESSPCVLHGFGPVAGGEWLHAVIYTSATHACCQSENLSSGHRPHRWHEGWRSQNVLRLCMHHSGRWTHRAGAEGYGQGCRIYGRDGWSSGLDSR